LIEQGSVRPPIAETVRLEDVNAALDRLRRGEALGRLVVRL
jgi:D-arabinose 1-dehydrogenase-like Zn-dependent alcohol dehydrogenase